jgi:hypothetical protein
LSIHPTLFFTPGIPWQDSNVDLKDKIESFLHGLDLLEDEIIMERVQQDFFSALATLQLLRLIYSTKAHPRTAILVQTIIVGLNDLLHFTLLFCVLVGGYIALGHAQFGWYRPEFKVRDFSILVFMSDEIVWSNFRNSYRASIVPRKSSGAFLSTFLENPLARFCQLSSEASCRLPRPSDHPPPLIFCLAEF